MNNLFLTIDILTLCNYADDNTLSTSGNDANTVIAQQTFLVFQDVFSVTFFVFQDVLKTYLQYVFLKRLQDVFQDVFKTFSRRLQDVFKTSWKIKKMLHWRCLQYVLTKTNVCWVVSWSGISQKQSNGSMKILWLLIQTWRYR